MIDAINCNGNFEAGFMRCLHGRNDAFFHNHFTTEFLFEVFV